MVAEDEDALVCDLCEHYGITNWRGGDLALVSTLALGLPDDSRIKTKLAGLPAPQPVIMQAAILDRLNMLVWMRSEDGAKRRNRPASIVQALYNANKTKNTIGYDTPEAFEQARAALING